MLKCDLRRYLNTFKYRLKIAFQHLDRRPWTTVLKEKVLSTKVFVVFPREQ